MLLTAAALSQNDRRIAIQQQQNVSALIIWHEHSFASFLYYSIYVEPLRCRVYTQFKKNIPKKTYSRLHICNSILYCSVSVKFFPTCLSFLLFREKLRLVLPSSTFLFHRTCFTILPDPDSPDISSLWGFYYPGRHRPSPNGACTTFWPRRKTGFPSLKHFSLFFLYLSHPLRLLHQGT